jgi:hypothetical protein
MRSGNLLGMARVDLALWTDRSTLTESQYRTDANLAARQSIYSYQQPPLDLAELVVDLAGLAGP